MNSTKTLTNGKAAVTGNRHKKPPTHPIDPAAIHDGLKMFDRWLGWRWTWNAKANKWDKPPIDARTGRPGSSTNPATWCTFDKALAAVRAGSCDGIGFALGEAEGGVHFAGIDLDNSRNRETGELSEVARDIIGTMNTYCEVSPSETGIKLLCIGSLPSGAATKNKAGTVEVYSGGRYFTITGRRVEGTPKRVEAREEQLADVWERYIGSEQRTQKSSTNGTHPTNGHATPAALAAMLRHKPDANESDGSKRLFAVACRAVEHDLSDAVTVATIGQYEQKHPFPSGWTDAEILARLRDAEKKTERGSAIDVANYEKIEVDGEDGETKTLNVPLSMNDIIDTINQRMGDWPRRVDNMLFVDDQKHGLDYFDRRTTAGLFGWLRRHCKVTWAKGGSFVSQAELFAEIERTTRRYEAIELLPHEPQIASLYYRGQAPKPGEGAHLRKLLERFRPETTIDRDLIQAAFMTPAWGGLPGCRPAFVVTSDDGRGVGKSKVAEAIGYLYGGYIDVSAGEDIETLKTRMLSPEARTKRIALLDNVKTLRLSWAELEAMITAPIISGRQLFVGEGQRPNLLTWFITLNGVSMATDMAQRSVIIKVVRGKNDGPWWEQTRQYIDTHRDKIIGDIIGALRAEPFPLAEFTRWATWEQHVLCRLPEPGDAQKMILERQAEADCELDEIGIIEEFFAEQLAKLDYDPNTAQVRIPVAVAARWYGWAVGEPTKTAAASKRLHQMAAEGQAKRIAPDSTRTYGRCFIWTGPAADVVGQPIANDLSDRIARMIDSRDA